jgi:hypothetical protein
MSRSRRVKKTVKRPKKTVAKSRRPKASKKVKKVKMSSSSRKPRGLKLISIKKSTRPGKKLMATFSDGTITHFGAAGMQNYGGVGKARHLSKERKKRYIQRHKKRENWNNPKTAGALSRWVLWNKETLKSSISDYKRRFKL